MPPARRLIVPAAGIAAAAFPFLWAATSVAGLAPRLAAAGWLAAGCLCALACPPGPAELALLAAVLAPGLYAALTVLGHLTVLDAWLLVARVLLALGLHAALAELARLFPARLRGPVRLVSAFGVPLLFVLWLWNGSLAAAAALPACAVGVLLLTRRAHA